MQTLFQVANLVVLPFWALMIALPRWRWTERIMQTWWPVIIPAAFYAALIVPRLPSVFGSLLNPTVDGVAALLGQPDGATIGWIHFLAFDLFVGRWAYLDSRERRLPWWLTSPALFLILMVGPLGWLGYLGVRLLAGHPKGDS